jgi:hypothetical protein
VRPYPETTSRTGLNHGETSDPYHLQLVSFCESALASRRRVERNRLRSLLYCRECLCHPISQSTGRPATFLLRLLSPDIQRYHSHKNSEEKVDLSRLQTPAFSVCLILHPMPLDQASRNKHAFPETSEKPRMSRWQSREDCGQQPQLAFCRKCKGGNCYHQKVRACQGKQK